MCHLKLSFLGWLKDGKIISVVFHHLQQLFFTCEVVVSSALLFCVIVCFWVFVKRRKKTYFFSLTFTLDFYGCWMLSHSLTLTWVPLPLPLAKSSQPYYFSKSYSRHSTLCSSLHACPISVTSGGTTLDQFGPHFFVPNISFDSRLKLKRTVFRNSFLPQLLKTIFLH